DGGVAEMTATFHRDYSRIIHIIPTTIPYSIDRSAIDAWRRAYWMNRANDFGTSP
ncbi:MAG: HNH/ENDO VII family nuclease, partial [Planctomycetaceae bacterium]